VLQEDGNESCHQQLLTVHVSVHTHNNVRSTWRDGGAATRNKNCLCCPAANTESIGNRSDLILKTQGIPKLFHLRLLRYSGYFPIRLLADSATSTSTRRNFPPQSDVPPSDHFHVAISNAVHLIFANAVTTLAIAY
jgi:hypothetical protein